jgi:hypothetical protein
MGALQDHMDTILEVRTLPLVVCKDLLRRAMTARGVALDPAQIEAIAISITEANSQADEPVTLTLDVSEEVGRAIEDFVAHDWRPLLSEYEAELLENAQRDAMSAIRQAATVVLERIERDHLRQLIDQRSENMEFEQRLYRRWSRGLDLLETQVGLALEAGDTFRSELTREFPQEPEHLFFEVLIPLHAKACRIAGEVLVLLKSGFADGAHARWRSLHEVAVTMLFLVEHGLAVQRAYHDHSAVERHKAAEQYQQHCETLDYEPISDEELKDIRQGRDDVASKYAKGFERDYGWAIVALGSDPPSFTNIEKSLSMDRWRPFYKMACHNVHAGSQGNWFTLGTPVERQPALLAGRSNAGLADPGQSTAISLTQATTALLSSKSNADRLMTTLVMTQLSDDIGEAFLAAHEELEDEEAASSPASPS